MLNLSLGRLGFWFDVNGAVAVFVLWDDTWCAIITYVRMTFMF